jgi:dihydrolipoamide dehydrogenase
VATKTFDVIILGGGPAGYVCAIRAAQLGLATAVVEREKLGGVCVNVGCIPSKALLHSAYVANLVQKDAKTLGVNAGTVSLDFGAAIQHSRNVSEQNSKGVEFLLKKHKVTVITGTGTLQKGRKVKVGKDTYTASKAVVIATGTRVKGIPQIGLELDRTTVISTDEALFLEAAPKSVAIVGAGAVGCEFADILNAFGTEVTLIEILPQILPLEDAESAAVVARSFKKRKIKMLTAATVKGAKVEKSGVTLDVEVGGKAQQIEAEKVLIGAGRALNTEDVGLDAAGVKLNEQGFIAVNQDLRCTPSATSPARRCWPTRGAGRACSSPSTWPGSSRTRSATTTSPA